VKGAVVRSKFQIVAYYRLFGHDDYPWYIVLQFTTVSASAATNSTHDFGVKFYCRLAPRTSVAIPEKEAQ
jgi:hypothetical protein